jgi:hypothetical protein
VKHNSAIALAVLAILLVLQPFLFNKFGLYVGVVPIAAFAIFMLWVGLRKSDQ